MTDDDTTITSASPDTSYSSPTITQQRVNARAMMPPPPPTSSSGFGSGAGSSIDNLPTNQQAHHQSQQLRYSQSALAASAEASPLPARPGSSTSIASRNPFLSDDGASESGDDRLSTRSHPLTAARQAAAASLTSSRPASSVSRHYAPVSSYVNASSLISASKSLNESVVQQQGSALANQQHQERYRSVSAVHPDNERVASSPVQSNQTPNVSQQQQQTQQSNYQQLPPGRPPSDQQYVYERRSSGSGPTLVPSYYAPPPHGAYVAPPHPAYYYQTAPHPPPQAGPQRPSSSSEAQRRISGSSTHSYDQRARNYSGSSIYGYLPGAFPEPIYAAPPAYMAMPMSVPLDGDLTPTSEHPPEAPQMAWHQPPPPMVAYYPYAPPPAPYGPYRYYDPYATYAPLPLAPGPQQSNYEPGARDSPRSASSSFSNYQNQPSGQQQQQAQQPHRPSESETPPPVPPPRPPARGDQQPPPPLPKRRDITSQSSGSPRTHMSGLQYSSGHQVAHQQYHHQRFMEESPPTTEAPPIPQPQRRRSSNQQPQSDFTRVSCKEFSTTGSSNSSSGVATVAEMNYTNSSSFPSSSTTVISRRTSFDPFNCAFVDKHLQELSVRTGGTPTAGTTMSTPGTMTTTTSSAGYTSRPPTLDDSTAQLISVSTTSSASNQRPRQISSVTNSSVSSNLSQILKPEKMTSTPLTSLDAEQRLGQLDFSAITSGSGEINAGGGGHSVNPNDTVNDSFGDFSSTVFFNSITDSVNFSSNSSAQPPTLGDIHGQSLTTPPVVGESSAVAKVAPFNHFGEDHISPEERNIFKKKSDPFADDDFFVSADNATTGGTTNTLEPLSTTSS